jgi:hypothetical protein
MNQNEKMPDSEIRWFDQLKIPNDLPSKRIDDDDGDSGLNDTWEDGDGYGDGW